MNEMLRAGAKGWGEPLDPGQADEPRYTIRLLQEADLPKVVNVDAHTTGRRRDSYYRAKFAACVSEPGLNLSLVAEDNGMTVGFLFGQLFYGEFGIPNARAVLDTIGVHPDFRGQGVGRELVEQYRKNLGALRIEAIDTLVSWDRTDLIAFFKQFGFRPSRIQDLVMEIGRTPFGSGPAAATVRDATTTTDVEAAARIDHEITRVSRQAYFEAKRKAAQERPEEMRFLVAEADDAVAGYLVCSTYEGEFGINERRGVIDSFSVSERYQHQGVGSALFSTLLERLQAQGVTHVETLCRWNDWPLQQFFAYAGFTPAPRLNLEWRFGTSESS